MNVTRLSVDAALTEEELCRAADRFHLRESLPADKLASISRRLAAYCRPSCIYAREGEQLLAAVTLGDGPERMQRRMKAAGDLLGAWAVDCLCMDMLKKLYAAIERSIGRKGIFLKKVTFPQPGRDAENLREITDRLGAGISFSPAGMMIPAKSTVFTAQLTEKKSGEVAGSCSQCSRSCPFRDEGGEQR